MTFILGLLKNPEAQRLGQAEVDRVVGVDRLPTHNDKDNLPYVQAMCEEALRSVIIALNPEFSHSLTYCRFGSVAPLGMRHPLSSDENMNDFKFAGFPHFTTEDDVYQGYHIPVGTTVLANQWCGILLPSSE